MVAFRFCKYLVQANPGLEIDFDQWLFLPGMTFGSGLKWWGNGGPRPQAHEGIDFCLYHNAGGRLCRLSADTRSAVAGDGVVVQVTDDFLGRSVFVHHPCFDRASFRLISAYGHLRPCSHVCPGHVAPAGEIIGALAPARQRHSLEHVFAVVDLFQANLLHAVIGILHISVYTFVYFL